MDGGSQCRAHTTRSRSTDVKTFQNHYPDPGITSGHFRVLPITTGGYAVIDDRRPPGHQRVALRGSLDDAANEAAIRDAEDEEEIRR